MAEICLQFPGLTEDARKKKVPLGFYVVIGQDLKEETSPSLFNVEEIVRENKVCGKLVDRFSISISMNYVV